MHENANTFMHAHIHIQSHVVAHKKFIELPATQQRSLHSEAVIMDSRDKSINMNI